MPEGRRERESSGVDTAYVHSGAASTSMFKLAAHRSFPHARHGLSRIKRQTRLGSSSTSQNATDHGAGARPPKNWLTKKLEESPAAKKAFLNLVNAMGYGSAKQVAGRRAFAMYEKCCITRAEEDRQFWQNGTYFHIADTRLRVWS